MNFQLLSSAITLLVVIPLVFTAPTGDDLIIQLPTGKIQGTTYKTPTNKTYYGFQGIPYAKPPLGHLRFEAPQPADPWDGVLDATQDGKSCASILHWSDPNGESEDCLFINVYTPSLKPAVKLSVMFWIYGGTFTQGTSSKQLYGPDFLVEDDVIMVSFNYRIAPFGFLSTADAVIRGNAGLKDQNLALKWTNENIALFGGDPKKITIFGQSAGGASTGLQVMSPKSAGLFRAAILESGCALSFWAIDEEPKEYAFILADKLNGSSYTNDTQKLKKFFQERTAEEIINATLSIPDEYHDYRAQVWPVMEVESEEAFLTDRPYELLESGNFNQVPIIIGMTSEESLMYIKNLDYAKVIAQGFDYEPKVAIPIDLRPNSSDTDAVAEAVHNIYLQENQTFSSNFVALANFFTDNLFARGIIKHAEMSSKYVPVYLYQFAYYGGRLITKAFIEGAERAGHEAEVPYLLNMGGISNTTDAPDLLTQNRMAKLWTNFAKYLNPTPEQSQLLDNVIWPTLNSTSKPYLNINDTLEVRSHLREDFFQKWNQIYHTYGKKPFITF